VNLLRQKWAIKKAAAVITDSQASKEGIVSKLDIPSNQVYVVPLAGNPAITELSESQARRYETQLELPKKYIVYVGDINYNKNLPALLLALTQLPEDLHLCVVSRTFGNKSIPEGQRLANIIRENDLEERVHQLDIPQDAPQMLSAVLQQSVALIQPSLWEGFGLPVLEAFQAGAVVVSSNTSSLPEVAGSAAIFTEPTIIGLVTGIERAMKLRGDDRQNLIELGRQQARRFSWTKTAQLTYQVYEDVVAQKRVL
jgi:alpha-1,3-rhamnosyl/mannosyltransferase